MLYVHQSGSPDAPAIVFLHGAGLSGSMWQPQFDRLPDYYCLAPDLPEQGRSSQIGPFRLEDAAIDVAAVIRQRVPSGRAHVIGHSLGGAVALTLLRLAPEVVDYMMVSGTSAKLGNVLSALSYASSYIYPLLPAETLVSSLMKQWRIPEAYREMLRNDLVLTTTPTFVKHYTNALCSLELPEEATSPLLVVTGSQETLVTQHMARTLVHKIKGACSMTIPNVGHVWNLESPDLFTDIVRAWISDDPLAQTWLPLQCEMV